MSVQNLRNKYYDHPFFEPLISYCDKNNISFEIMKETYITQNYKIKKVYYIKIEDILIYKHVDNSCWNNLAIMLTKCYTYLGLDIPESLEYLIKMYEGKNNV